MKRRAPFIVTAAAAAALTGCLGTSNPAFDSGPSTDSATSNPAVDSGDSCDSGQEPADTGCEPKDEAS